MGVTAKETEAIKLYCQAMTEIKDRSIAISVALNNANRLFPPRIVGEFCYLQLRMIYELIALGCLVAHGDITPRKAELTGTWKPEKILNELEKIHPPFFPQALTPKPSKKTGILDLRNLDHAVPASPPVMTKRQLISLHGKCGNHTHRGNLKDFTKTLFTLPQIMVETQNALNLLTFHQVAMLDEDRMFLCLLNNVKLNNSVTVTLVSKTPPDRSDARVS